MLHVKQSKKVPIINLPNQFCDILEKILISKRLFFKKVAIMPKDKSAKIKGSIRHTSVEVMDRSTLLPRETNSSGLSIVKLKRKLEYRGHVYFGLLHPDIVLGLLKFLKANNNIYKDVTIVPSNIPTALVDS